MLRTHDCAHGKSCDVVQSVREVEKCDCTRNTWRLFERDPSVYWCPVLIIAVCGRVQVKAKGQYKQRNGFTSARESYSSSLSAGALPIVTLLIRSWYTRHQNALFHSSSLMLGLGLYTFFRCAPTSWMSRNPMPTRFQHAWGDEQLIT